MPVRYIFLFWVISAGLFAIAHGCKDCCEKCRSSCQRSESFSKSVYTLIRYVLNDEGTECVGRSSFLCAGKFHKTKEGCTRCCVKKQ
ncbi:hypothetical protein V5799_017826 [Amblyomma americanum]|uniref:Secreted protein n=1 Tax=Amblyomma americanum TaxID=6943 RepID=A0AAQ4F251_AMBAM